VPGLPSTSKSTGTGFRSTETLRPFPTLWWAEWSIETFLEGRRSGGVHPRAQAGSWPVGLMALAEQGHARGHGNQETEDQLIARTPCTTGAESPNERTRWRGIRACFGPPPRGEVTKVQFQRLLLSADKGSEGILIQEPRILHCFCYSKKLLFRTHQSRSRARPRQARDHEAAAADWSQGQGAFKGDPMISVDFDGWLANAALLTVLLCGAWSVVGILPVRPLQPTGGPPATNPAWCPAGVAPPAGRCQQVQPCWLSGNRGLKESSRPANEPRCSPQPLGSGARRIDDWPLVGPGPPLGNRPHLVVQLDIQETRCGLK